jgi:hypothetical protein
LPVGNIDRREKSLCQMLHRSPELGAWSLQNRSDFGTAPVDEEAFHDVPVSAIETQALTRRYRTPVE